MAASVLQSFKSVPLLGTHLFQQMPWSEKSPRLDIEGAVVAIATATLSLNCPNAATSHRCTAHKSNFWDTDKHERTMQTCCFRLPHEIVQSVLSKASNMSDYFEVSTSGWWAITRLRAVFGATLPHSTRRTRCIGTHEHHDESWFGEQKQLMRDEPFVSLCLFLLTIAEARKPKFIKLDFRYFLIFLTFLKTCVFLAFSETKNITNDKHSICYF